MAEWYTSHRPPVCPSSRNAEMEDPIGILIMGCSLPINFLLKILIAKALIVIHMFIGNFKFSVVLKVILNLVRALPTMSVSILAYSLSLFNKVL